MFISMPSIGQFRNVIRAVSIKASYVGKDGAGEAIYDGSLPKPIIKYRGEIKLHGSNAAIVRMPDGTYQTQSRGRTITPEKDNAGFAWLIATVPKEVIDHMFSSLVPLSSGRPCVLYGEIAGGNVQQGVALAQLEKFFCIFGACVKGDAEGDSREWIDMASLPQLPCSPEHRIFNILQPEFEHYELEIDFNKPELVQNQLVEITNKVEKECPFGKAFGVIGVGEGVVWKPITPGWEDAGYWFKCKGMEHSSSKVKTLAEVDVEKVASLYEFADKVCTKSRLEQGLAWVKENGNERILTERSTGQFIKWMVSDCIKEETDTMIASGISPTEVGKAVGTHARKWYFDYLKKELPSATDLTATDNRAPN